MKCAHLVFSGLLFFNVSGMAAPSVTERQTYYKISGNTADELRAEMSTLGPVDHDRHVDAKTTWHVNWNYTWQYDNPSQNPCYVTGVKVSGDITYLMPEWLNMDSNDPALRAKWRTYLINLKNHEDGHANNGVQAANDIGQALQHVPAQTNCQILQNKLEDIAHQVIKNHNDWDIKYDTDTGHGKTQGVVFP